MQATTEESAEALSIDWESPTLEQLTGLVRRRACERLMATVHPTQIALALKTLVNNSPEVVKPDSSVEVNTPTKSALQISTYKLDESHPAVPPPNLAYAIRN